MSCSPAVKEQVEIETMDVEQECALKNIEDTLQAYVY